MEWSSSTRVHNRSEAAELTRLELRPLIPLFSPRDVSVHGFETEGKYLTSDRWPITLAGYEWLRGYTNQVQPLSSSASMWLAKGHDNGNRLEGKLVIATKRLKEESRWSSRRIAARWKPRAPQPQVKQRKTFTFPPPWGIAAVRALRNGSFRSGFEMNFSEYWEFRMRIFNTF